MGSLLTTSQGRRRALDDLPPCEDVVTVVRIGPQESELPPAPRVFWTYWQDTPLPPIVQACTRSWAKHHPDFQIRVVTRANLPEHLPGVQSPLEDAYPWIDSPARESDLVRLLLLAKHGGVWLDATFLLAQPLAFFHGTMATQGHRPELAGFYLQGFTTNPDSPVLESWALAARPGAPFAAAWLRELLSIPPHPDGTAAKLKQYEAARVDTQAVIAPHYLLIHIAAQFLMQYRRHLVSMELLCAEEGPYLYLQDTEWDAGKSVRTMVAQYPSAGGVFKLRSTERGYLTDSDVAHLLQAL